MGVGDGGGGEPHGGDAGAGAGAGSQVAGDGEGLRRQGREAYVATPVGEQPPLGAVDALGVVGEYGLQGVGHALVGGAQLRRCGRGTICGSLAAVVIGESPAAISAGQRCAITIRLQSSQTEVTPWPTASSARPSWRRPCVRPTPSTSESCFCWVVRPTDPRLRPPEHWPQGLVAESSPGMTHSQTLHRTRPHRLFPTQIQHWAHWNSVVGQQQ